MIFVLKNWHFTFLTVHSIPTELPYHKAKMIVKSYSKVQGVVCSNYKVKTVSFPAEHMRSLPQQANLTLST